MNQSKIHQGRRIALAAGAALACAIAAPSWAADGPLNIGFVYVSPIGDAGWTFQHDKGRHELEAALGDKVKTKVVESVPEGADAERVIRELAKSGNQLIFTTSFGYMNPTLKVAKAFPKTKFVHVTGYKTAKNVAQVNARFYEGRYVAGVIAGTMSKSGQAGYVAAFPIPEVLQGINAFMRGMRSVNPDASMRIIWTNSWYDPGKEREASLALISQGADVLTHHTDSPSAVQVAEEKGVYAVGYHSDMSKYGPKAHLAAVTHNWGDYYVKTAKQVVDGSWKTSMVWGGMKDGFIRVEGLNPGLPKDLVAKVDQLQADIKAGKLHPFAGPVVDQDGKEIIPAGKTMTDEQMGQMDFYVQGIVGKLPK
ncbi:MAG: BMP family ABC transporter substrate-binding protein [Burkholderiaceae bacterium]